MKLVKEISSIPDIQRLVLAGFEDWRRYGEVNARRFGNHIIFNYAAKAQYDNRWNYFERVSRGLIIHVPTGEITARAFDKFFNWGEGAHYPPPHTRPVMVTEKMDGSLGILWRDEQEKFRIATRGSLESDQAVWATEFLNKHYCLDALPSYATLLFEIIYPENRVVVDYGLREQLVLLYARNRFTGRYVDRWVVDRWAGEFGFPQPTWVRFDTFEQIRARADTLGWNHEGFVAVTEDFQFWKFKGLEYLKAHKAIHNLSFTAIVEALRTFTFEDLLTYLPDVFVKQAKQMQAFIRRHVLMTLVRAYELFEQLPRVDRKTFALEAVKYPEYKRYLFALFDGKQIEDMVYQCVDWNEVAKEYYANAKYHADDSARY